jgi:hypothetical protein
MADLSLSPAPSAAAPAAAPAPAASRPAAEPLKAETADPDEDKDEAETPTRAAPAAPKVTVAGAASSSEALGGFIPDLFSDGTDAASSVISTGRALQPLPTVTQVGAVPTATGSSILDGLSHAADECSSGQTSCQDTLTRTTVTASVGGVRKSIVQFTVLPLRSVCIVVAIVLIFFCWYRPRRDSRRLKSEV